MFGQQSVQPGLVDRLTMAASSWRSRMHLASVNKAPVVRGRRGVLMRPILVPGVLARGVLVADMRMHACWSGWPCRDGRAQPQDIRMGSFKT